MASDWILGKDRIVRQKGRYHTGNSWLIYRRYFIIGEKKCKMKYLSMREINKLWGSNPVLFRG